MKLDVCELTLDSPVHTKFKNHIENNCYSVRLLALKIGIEQPYLSNMLKGVLPLSRKIHKKLNETLGTNY